MTNRYKLAAAAAIVAIAGLVAAVPAGAAPGKPVTTGMLAVDLARAAGVQLPERDTAAAAARELRQIGIVLGRSLDATVRERDLVEIGRSLGAAVVTSEPDKPVSPAKGLAFVGLMSDAMTAAQATTGDIRVSCQGRNSRVNRRGTPASPASPNATAPPCEEEPIP